ncbi:MAG: phosphatase PAP2 family protein [Endomicrobiales bacterium]
MLWGIAAASLSGCGTLGHGRNTWFPSAGRAGDSAKKALFAPGTWAPLAVAGAVYAAGADPALSNWATEHTPVFGSSENADEWSNYLASGAQGAQLVTALVAYDGRHQEHWAITKLKFLAAGFLAAQLDYSSTGFVKRASGRLRPDGSDLTSFPSSHASHASAAAAAASCQLEYLPLSPAGRTVMRAGVYSLSAMTAWARVEAKKHYVSDVLAGAAFGHFIGAFTHRLLAEGDGAWPQVSVNSRGDGVTVRFTSEF